MLKMLQNIETYPNFPEKYYFKAILSKQKRFETFSQIFLTNYLKS